MSRSGYSDDYGDDFPGQMELYRANVDRAFHSKRRRQRLAELAAALDRMPVKELHADVFIEQRDEPSAPWIHLPDDPPAAPKGATCALAAWAVDALGREAATALLPESEPTADEIADALVRHGWPRLVVQDIVYFNDDRDEGRRRLYVHGPKTRQQSRYPYADPCGSGGVCYLVDETPAERWTRMRAKVDRWILEIARRDAGIAAWKAAHPYTTPSPAGVGLL